MIASNNSSVDVNALMERVRAEAAAMRAREGTGNGSAAMSAPIADPIVSEGGVDLSRHAIIGSLVEDAVRMSRPRTALPKRLKRMPYKLGAPFFAFALRILRYLFKDQAHVNASTQQALRELLRYATTIGGHVSQLTSIARDQRNAARHMATLSARVDASEQRASELLDLHHIVEARVGAIEQALTINAKRIDALEVAAINSERTSAVENALTVNAKRIDALEGVTGRSRDRLSALESANTIASERFERLEATGRIDALETASTIAAQRLERLEGGEARADLIVTSISDTRHELAAERERALRAEASLRGDLTSVRNAQTLPTSIGTNGAGTSSAPVPGAYADVHLAISDKFRGDSANITKQLEAYVSIVRGEGAVDTDHPLVDVGSGRGEFLATCRDANIPSFGVELDPFLAERARMDGIDVRDNDAVAALRALNDASIGAVTAFHVIEHLPFDALLAFFDESLRALAPGGVIVCETPNPANVTIGSCNFYLDPTHLHPLPAPLVAFLLEVRGFTDVRIIELQPNDTMKLDEDTEAARRINGFFYGPQNYAAIANKPGASN